MNTIRDCASQRNNIPSQPEQDLRAELTALQARYDSGAVSSAVYAVVKAIETELGWLQHRGRP
jgi:hypothetical protein